MSNSGSNKNSFINNLIEYANLYQNNINPNFLNEDISRDSYIERLNIVAFGLNTTTIIPYILFTLKDVESSHEQNNMFKLIETYLVRRLICKETTKNYNNLFASLIRNKVSSYEELLVKLCENEDSTNIMPNNEELKRCFEESILTNQQAKTVL